MFAIYFVVFCTLYSITAYNNFILLIKTHIKFYLKVKKLSMDVRMYLLIIVELLYPPHAVTFKNE